MEAPSTSQGDLSATAVLAVLGRSGPLSRAELGRQLGVSPATVTKLIRRLLAQGFVQELDLIPSAGGRPARRVSLAGDAGYAVGLKVSVNRVTGVICGLDGEIVETFGFDYAAREPNAIEYLMERVRPYVAGSKSQRMLGIGVGLPGTVDIQGGGLVDSPMLGWVGVRLGAALEAALGLPTLVDNDVNTVAVAERLYGRGREVPNFLVVTIGRGVGMAVLIDGRLYRGVSGGAGEFGHWPMADDGPLCDCGNRGCLETFIGYDGLLAAARARGLPVGGGPPGGGLPPGGGAMAELVALADEGDEHARTVFAEAGALLGRSLAGLVNVLNPGLVLATGEGVSAWRHWQAGFQPALRAHLFGLMRRVSFEVDSWDDHAWARGAAALVLAAPLAAATDHERPAALVRARLTGVVGAGRGA